MKTNVRNGDLHVEMFVLPFKCLNSAQILYIFFSSLSILCGVYNINFLGSLIFNKLWIGYCEISKQKRYNF